MITKMFDIEIKTVAAKVTRALEMFRWAFANLFRFKLSGFSKLQQNLKNYKHFLFSAVSVYVAL